MTDAAALRREFPTTARWAHFDCARKAPWPRVVEETIARFTRDVYENAGEGVFSMERADEARKTVARLVGVPAPSLAFVKSTSEGINIVARGIGLEPGDRVLVTDQEHGANVYPWRHLASRGVGVDVVEARQGRLPLPSFVERLTERTRIVAVSWVTYANGFRVDVPALGRACRRHGALLLVDAIQGVGILDTPLGELGADFVTSGGHKGLLGLVGAGFLHVRESLISSIEPAYVARFSFAQDQKWAEHLKLESDARRFEYGNPNFLALAVLKRSAEFLMEIGLGAIEERVRALTTGLMDRAESRGIALATPRPWSERAGIVALSVPDARGVAQRLRARNILVSVKDGHLLRASCHVYNTEEEIDRLVDGIADTGT